MANTKIPVELSSTPSIVDGGNATAITIDSSERVGIGRVPNANGVLQISVATNENCNLIFSENTDEKWLIGNVYTNDDLRFINMATSSEKIRLLSGGGLTFNGDTAAANALDDYEEGTWTPTFANIGTGTYSNNIGRYTKIGNRVFAEFHLDIALIGNASGSLIINGLPFLSVNVANNYGSMTTAHAGGWTGAFANLGGLVEGNTTYMGVYYQNTSGATAAATHANMQVGNFLATIIYQAA